MSLSSDIAKLREETGAGVMDCKKALEASGNDFNKAKKALAANADAIDKKKAERSTKSGVIESYVHSGKIGVLIEVNCESDFVAKNDDFKKMVHNLVLQIASMNPKDVTEFLSQDYILEPSMKIEEYINSLIGKIRENIQVKRFVRFELGEEEK